MTEKEKIHNKQVEKLTELEKELIVLIVDTENEQLQEKFGQWQDQRILCNETYLEYWEAVLEALPKKKSL